MSKARDIADSAATINVLDGVTSTAAELNILDGVTATAAELNYVDGVTSAIQTQIDTLDPLPTQTANTGKFLTTNGTAASWAAAATLGTNTFTGLQTLSTGADIASATAVDLTAATGNTVVITGTTASTSLTMTAGQQMVLLPSGAWPLTYHATTMKLNGGGNYTC